MLKCPNCSYLWPDEHTGQCGECGNPMSGSLNQNQDLHFRFARQVQEGVRENSLESSMRRGRYDGLKLEEGILDRARQMIVQREEVRYEEE